MVGECMVGPGHLPCIHSCSGLKMTLVEKSVRLDDVSQHIFLQAFLADGGSAGLLWPKAWHRAIAIHGGPRPESGAQGARGKNGSHSTEYQRGRLVAGWVADDDRLCQKLEDG